MVRFVSFLFAIMAVLSPWFIGGNYPFARTALIAACSLSLILIAAGLVLGGRHNATQKMKIPWLWWVLLLGVAFTAFQASPQSAEIQSKFGIENYSISNSSDNQSDAGVVDESELSGIAEASQPISAYAPATRSKLVDLLFGVGLFVAASLVLHEPRSTMPVLAALAVVGVLVSFVGVLQILSGDSKLLWQYELLWGGDPFASFVNGNNAAGFLLICFSACMFFVAKLVLGFGRSEITEGAYHDSELDPPAIKKLLRSFSRLQSQHLYCLTAIVVIAAGVMMTGSRGGILALVTCGAFAGLALSRSSIFAAIGLTIAIVACSVGFVVYSEQGNRVSDEVETLSDFSEAAAPRLQHWNEAIRFGVSNAALGTGNGTYRYLSPGFQELFTTKTFAHAENVYIETFVEMGIGGVLLLLLCIFYCLYACIGLFRRADLYDRALAVAGITCISGQVAIAFLDFGIYQPANCTAMALMMGAIAGRYSIPAEEEPQVSRGSLSHFMKLGVVALLLLVTCWGTYESWGIELRRSAKRSIKLLHRYGSEGPNKTRQVSLSAVKNQLEQAEAIRPDDAAVQYLFGELGVSQFRLERAKLIKQEVSDGLAELEDLELTSSERDFRREQLEAFDVATIWNMTAISLLHQQLRATQRSNSTNAKEILNAPTVREYLPESFERFTKADELMGRLPLSRVKMAQLVGLCDVHQTPQTLEAEQQYIEEALSRSIPKTQTLFSCGLLTLNSGDQDLAVELWRKCLQRPHLFVHEKAIVEFSLQMLPMKRLYEEVLPQNPKYLLKIARRYLSGAEYSLPQKFLIVHVRRMINGMDSLTELEKNRLLAEAANLISDYPSLVKNYGSVLELASLQASERYDYAFALFKMKQFDEAVRQLKVCELDPSFRKNRIKWLLDRIRQERSRRSP